MFRLKGDMKPADIVFDVSMLIDHIHVCIIKGLRPILEGFVVTMHEGPCEQEV